MRTIRFLLLVVLALSMTVGCTKQIEGTAQPDPNKPPLTLAKDGFGVVAGFDDAPKRIEIFTEPQCTHCAQLQADFGDQFAYYITTGALKITYRPLTFLDLSSNGYSAHVANAMFLAAAKGGDETPPTGTQFQRFVEELWGHQTPGSKGPSNDEMADMAKKAGLPDAAVKRIADGKSAVDIGDMGDANFEYLYEIDPMSTGTPTVYDPAKDEKLDIFDNDWLSKFMQK